MKNIGEWKTMELNLDLAINKKLREILNEDHNFMYERKAKFKVPGKRGEMEESRAFNCICACLDRIDSLVVHCNDISKNIENIYGLCDILNYGQTLIDCISMIAQIYGVTYNSEGDISCFNESGLDGKGNDEKFFKYIRSLCSVHPVETSYHPSYQGEQPEWCPWISKAESQSHIWQFDKDCSEKLKEADFVAIVYRNDLEYNKHVYISLKQIYKYLRKRYSYINTIIDTIKKQNEEKICELRNKHILLPEECKDYDSYLNELKKAIEERCRDNSSWRINQWKTVLNSHFKNHNFEELLELYKADLKKGIEKVHLSLQRMELDYYFEKEAVDYITSFIPSEYAYSLSKLHYLEPIWENEAFDCEEILSEDRYTGDYERLVKLLNVVTHIQSNMDEVDINIVNREIDVKYQTTNAEWARVQLKWLEPYCDIKFNYELGDWYLYLQTIVSFWKIAKSMEK